MSKKENKLVVLYNDIEQRNNYKLNGVDVTDEIENLIDHLEKEIIDTKCRLFHLDMGVIRVKDQKIVNLEAKLSESENKIKELRGERLKFYTDDVRRTQVINGVHFDIEHLLVFSEYVEHEKNISADKDKEIAQLKQQLAEKEKAKTDFAIEQLKQTKKLIEEKYTYDVEESDWAVVYELDIDEIFDQQIKELKEGK